MRFLAPVAFCALVVSVSSAEDPQLRARAFELVERAQDVSAAKHSAPLVNETVLTFHALATDGSMREGSYTRVFAGPTGMRQEFNSADFHLVQVDLPDRAIFIGKSRVLPPEFREMLRLFPIQLWRLDHEDVVKEIKKNNRKGVDAQCVEFDTIRGAETENNELCFDARSGAQIYARTGKMEVENSAFFDFGGGKLPAHITQYRNGTPMLDIQLTRRVITDQLSPDMFTAPPSADIGMRCRTFRRAFGQSMPQPAAGTGAALTEIVVHAVIGFDGNVQQAEIQDSDRPDLNEEALKTARTWTFTPAMCDGKPNPQEADFVLRFQGR